MRANASDAFGIASVQFDIDGANFGVPVTTPDSGTFSYSASLDVSGFAAEAHQLQATATDIVGNKVRRAARSFNVGAAPPTISLVVPPGTVGSLSGFGRRNRFEVHTNTTIAQFAAAPLSGAPPPFGSTRLGYEAAIGERPRTPMGDLKRPHEPAKQRGGR